jgi:hypothetical protein
MLSDDLAHWLAVSNGRLVFPSSQRGENGKRERLVVGARDTSCLDFRFAGAIDDEIEIHGIACGPWRRLKIGPGLRDQTRLVRYGAVPIHHSTSHEGRIALTQRTRGRRGIMLCAAGRASGDDNDHEE